ncbi:phenylalanine--tRNA ligase subunit alpha [candidate division WWE3 bacterium RIFOXYC1_FULL_39_7]|uniref:phenylalanine--tRNA ligase n=2 Tax=Katanobacteria TaxID=422282 RepID=A0A1F4X8W0_UNCKA|nr:MAG: phenylalanine--tRNA ligase subunit alpha [candidate division WWE3 bacterium RIFOXYC1_FULL_39_7]OGC78116.1 MAG: phenylalanine--tRNA ligase subunit alpha [candidate division WWE3 bacterium RIFOXYD1_FULL_39_9]
MQDDINNIRKMFEKDLETYSKSGDFDELYLKYFSKTHGLVTNLLKKIPSLSAEEKRTFGTSINTIQNELKQAITEAKAAFKTATINDPAIDLSIPEVPLNSGELHPITKTIIEMNKFFRYHGYSIAEGPEIETVEYNFRKLNLPEGHPATDLQDTLFVKEPDILLRTHTSSIESRILSEYEPPLRVIVPGKVYRNETANASNLGFFHQYQGFVVDKGVTIQHLKGILEEFHKFLFGENVVLRFRYKYYPEVSPGMGVDIRCQFCEGAGCTVCRQRGWVEVLGSGMIHYNTLKMCGIDPEEYTGFAFGMGLDRLAMSKFGISDIRKLYSGEMIYV